MTMNATMITTMITAITTITAMGRRGGEKVS
jgi:hypothetical protein